MKKYIIIITAALTICSCGGNRGKADDPISESGRTKRTENLLDNLIALCDSSVYLFGHHDDTVYGIGWEADYDNDSTVHILSDVKSVCNDFPALLGFDLGHIETGGECNIDGVPFKRIRQEIIAHYDRGGMTTLSWTVEKGDKSKADIDHVAQFLNTLETPYGVRVPVLFRLRGAFTKELWQMTVEQLREKDVVNALYAYSSGTEAGGDVEKYLERYPGDDYIDLLGIDRYCLAPAADTIQIANYAAQLDKDLAMVCREAKKRQKAVALTETGYEGIKTDNWWTHTLAPVLARHPISYVLVWRNAHNQTNHYNAPYPGQMSTSDFVRFYNSENTLFLRDVNGLYLNWKQH